MVQQKPKKSRKMNPNSLKNLRSDANPGGRPKKIFELKELCLSKLPDVFDVISRIAADPDARPADRLAACKIITEYAVGKPPQTMDVNLSGGVTLIDDL